MKKLNPYIPRISATSYPTAMRHRVGHGVTGLTAVLTAGDEFLSKQTMLVISPHADDEAFGCAGTIAKIKALGGKAYIMIMSVGDLKHYDGRNAIVKGKTRQDEFTRTAEFLKVDGYDVVFTEPAKHLRLDAIPQRDLIAVIERESKVAIDRVKPTIVALPAISYNQDHCAVFNAGFTACRPHLHHIKHFPPIVLTYDNPTLFWNVHNDKFHPNFYVDISDYVNVKLKALSFHKSQLKDRLHHCSMETLETLVRLRGKEISVEVAEAYMCYRFVW
ncbi:MAG: PIG-L family deacetylase [Planctomycetes bacterium]|nr:PIG-L family deacetylase [Planctomycetota bacterium]